MLPWKRAWVGVCSEVRGLVVEGIWVSWAVEKPPMVASERVLVQVRVSGSLKLRRGRGAVGTERASNLRAVVGMVLAGDCVGWMEAAVVGERCFGSLDAV